jgi:GTP diphosphokinase / guanosine-3',5'-bis(diphosphate) 3'-diphosphatase
MQVSSSSSGFTPANVAPAISFQELMRKIQLARPKEDLDLLRRAYEFSARYHSMQVRASGEPYLSHPLAVAHTLADMKLDVVCVSTGLLHDVVEDTEAKIDVIKSQFGPEVAHLVEGLTKISKLDFQSAEERQAENFRKMLLAMVDDVRVILVKLADRLHNMRTLQHVSQEKQERIARETMDIYAPLAHRLGMSKIRGELEDLAFRYLEPTSFEDITKALDKKRKVNEAFLAEVAGVLDSTMRKHDIPARLEGRVKRVYSIHQKLRRQRITIDQVYDLLAVRIITETVKDCYAALGVIHNLWRPVPGRIKDFIAMPRPNLYQSLHTSVIHDTGVPFEVQIRTSEMHKTAELGIAAHWRYKEDGPGATKPSTKDMLDEDQRVSWLRQLVEWQRDVQDPGEFLSTLKIDLYPEEVYTFTPAGKVIILPRDATPVDFAYEIHTEVGHACVGAKVNGRIVPLRYHLKNGDIVEILNQQGHGPSRDWLTVVKTSKARNKIRQWINTRARQKALELGRRLLEKEARRFDVNLKKLPDDAYPKAAQEYGFHKVDDLMAAIGFGKYSARQVLTRLSPQPLKEPEESSKLVTTIKQALGIAGDGAIIVAGSNDLMTYRAKCCNPIRGEPIVGYITRGKGIGVHSKTCPNVENLMYEAERRIDVEWARTAEDTYPVKIVVYTDERPGMLKEITQAISDGTNIRTIEAMVDETDHSATIELILDISDMKHLDRVLGGIKRISGVRDIERILKL